ncbi:MAG: tetratricopeptide repeat protein [Alistipes sp.]|jgi:TolA-binding protein|nr:tetratricopeptide repeat protein [Alistipes sp.]MBQ5899850.1 tetratricopeptide repeat protein [Alistipes sp.]
MAKEVVTPQDEMLASAQTQGENFFEKNSKMVVVAIVVIFVLAAAIFGYKKVIVEPRNVKGQEMLFEAQYQFESQTADFALALNGDENTPGFAQVVEQYGNTPAGNLARMYAASCALRLGDFDQAQKYINSYKNVKGVPGAIINAMAAGIKGEIAVEKGDNAGAAKLFEQAAKSNENDFTTPMYLRKAALAYRAAGDAAKADALLKVIAEEYPSSFDARDAQKLVD